MKLVFNGTYMPSNVRAWITINRITPYGAH